jgi:hypothetical protein
MLRENHNKNSMYANYTTAVTATAKPKNSVCRNRASGQDPNVSDSVIPEDN